MRSYVTASLIGLFSTPVLAADYNIPNSFSANTPAVAAEVNANFTAAKTAIDENNARVGVNESDIATNAAAIGSNASDIAANSNAITTVDSKADTNAVNIGVNAAGIAANTAAIAASGGGLQVVRDADSSVVGALISTDKFSWTVLNQQGYLVRLTADGIPASELVYFTGPNCTGTPYLLINNTGGAATVEQSNPIYAKQGYVFKDFLNNGVYFVAKNTPASTSITHQSRILTTQCQATTATIDAIQAAINVSGTTGVPDSGYGAVSLQ